VWKEKVTLTSQAWTQAEIDSLIDFRHSIISLVLRRAEERAELTLQLQQSNRELESFSYSVSHDLRAPFRHIVGYTQLLRDREKNLTDLSQHYLTSIVEAAASAGQLVDDLLNFSHLGRASLDFTQVDANKLVQEALRTLELDTRERNIDWRIGKLPPVWGDASLLRQVFVNLLQNAVKYTRSRDLAVIEVAGVCDDKECTYSVKDNGVGFDMAYADKLFGVFQRLHRMEDYEGTGIGLALTKRIIDRHKGWIVAEGAFDVGATFRFGIPLKPASSPNA
jgi:light-regulated signal transduction histidine kinase (bacteriophytochrome)